MVIRSTERLTLTKEPSPIVFCENAANRRSDCRSDGPDTKQDMIYEFSTNQDYGPVPDKTYAPNMPLFHDQTQGNGKNAGRMYSIKKDLHERPTKSQRYKVCNDDLRQG